MNFYIADTHFFHKNIIHIDGRPFFDVEEMNKKMIDNWNGVVGNNDTVYILGDFTLKASTSELILLSKQLNGKKVLIIGNHDKCLPFFHELRGFTSFHNYLEMVDEVDGEKYGVFLSHYPIPWFRAHRRPKNAHLFGHVHKTKEFDHVLEAREKLMSDPLTKSYGRIYNVGAMLPYINYTPRTLKEIIDGGDEYYKLSGQPVTLSEGGGNE